MIYSRKRIILSAGDDMGPVRIESASNDRIKLLKKLTNSSAERRERGAFVLDGARLCRDAVRSGRVPLEVYMTPEFVSRMPDAAGEIARGCPSVFEIAGKAAAAVSDTDAPQGVFAVFPLAGDKMTLDKSSFTDKINKRGVYIALENVQNPGNLGATARTAEALGADGMVICGGCDVYSPKAQRAAMGSLLRLPVFLADGLPAALKLFEEAGMTTLASVPDASALPVTKLGKREGLVCAVGNEGAGLSEEAVNACRLRVTVPMAGRAESLNAAAAAAILMWELLKPEGEPDE